MSIYSKNFFDLKERSRDLIRSYQGWVNSNISNVCYNLDLDLPIIICSASKDSACFHFSIEHLSKLGYKNIYCILEDKFFLDEKVKGIITKYYYDNEIIARYPDIKHLSPWYYQQAVKFLCFDIFDLNNYDGVYLLDADTILNKGIPYYKNYSLPLLLYSYENPNTYDDFIKFFGYNNKNMSFVTHQCYYPKTLVNEIFLSRDVDGFLKLLYGFQSSNIRVSEYQLIGCFRLISENIPPFFFRNLDIQSLDQFEIDSPHLSQSIQAWKKNRSLISWFYYKLLGNGFRLFN